MEGLNGRLERYVPSNGTENVPVSPQGGTGIFCARIGSRFHRAEKESARRGWGWNSRRWAGVVSPVLRRGEKGNSFFPKRWDSGVGRIIWGGGRWESGLMGKPLYGSREGKYTLGLGMEQSPLGRCGLPCFTAGRKKRNSFFLKRWDSGVDRIFWGSGRWESGLMGKPIYGSREGKRAGGARRGWNSRRWAGVAPLFYTGGRKGKHSLSKRGGNVFPEAKKSGKTPFPRGGNRAKIGGKTETRETFLWISKKDWDG